MRSMTTHPAKLLAVCGLAAVLAITTVGYAAEPAPAANTGTITGVVRGQDGKPAANAAVKLSENAKGFRPDQPNKTAEKPAKGEKKKAKALSATTDADGRFKIDNVPPGQYKVTGSITGTSRGTTNVAIKAGETTDVAISMHASK